MMRDFAGLLPAIQKSRTAGTSRVSSTVGSDDLLVATLCVGHLLPQARLKAP